MNLTVIMFFSSSVFLCYVPALYPKRLEAYQRNVQSSFFRGWLVILVQTALLVSMTVYIEPPPRDR